MDSSCQSYNPSFSASHTVARNAKDQKKVGGRKATGKAVKLSTEAQSVAARERRHRISERFQILRSLVPGGSKMDTVSMLEEAIHYVKFLKTQIWLHQSMINSVDGDPNLPLYPDYLFPKQSTAYLYAQASPYNMVAETHALPQLGLPSSATSLSYGEITATPFDAKMLY